MQKVNGVFILSDDTPKNIKKQKFYHRTNLTDCFYSPLVNYTVIGGDPIQPWGRPLRLINFFFVLNFFSPSPEWCHLVKRGVTWPLGKKNNGIKDQGTVIQIMVSWIDAIFKYASPSKRLYYMGVTHIHAYLKLSVFYYSGFFLFLIFSLAREQRETTEML